MPGKVEILCLTRERTSIHVLPSKIKYYGSVFPRKYFHAPDNASGRYEVIKRMTCNEFKQEAFSLDRFSGYL